MSITPNGDSLPDTIPVFPATSVEADLIREFTSYCLAVQGEFRFAVLSEYPMNAKRIVIDMFLKEHLLTAELCLAKAKEMRAACGTDFFDGAVIYWQACCGCINWLKSQLNHAQKWK
jgi:hypothetical protein